MPDTVHVHVETHEGTLLYTDDQAQQSRRAIGVLTVALLNKDDGGTQASWRTVGPIAAVTQGLAEMFIATPGLYEAVMGMYLLALRTKEQQLLQLGMKPLLQLGTCTCGHFRLAHPTARCAIPDCGCVEFKEVK